MKAKESVVAGRKMPADKRAMVICIAFLFWIPGARIGITWSLRTYTH